MKKIIITALGFLLFASPLTAFANIAFVRALTEQSGTSASFDATGCTFLHVFIMRRSGTTISVTYNSVSMTQIAVNTGHNVSATDDIFSFGLKSPTTGSNTIAITSNGSLFRWSAACYSGSDTSGTGWEAANTASASSGALACTVTPTKRDWILGGGWVNVVPTADSNTTFRDNEAGLILMDSNVDTTTAYGIGYTNNTQGDLTCFGLIDATQPAPTFIPFSFFFKILGDWNGRGW